MNSTRKLLGITVVLLTIIGLSSGATAFTVTWSEPSGTISGTVGLNITVSSGAGVNQTVFYQNNTGTFTEIGIDETNNSNDQTEWNISFDTTTVSDGALLLSANATNTTGNSSSATREVTIDNAGPTFDIEIPSQENANITSDSTFLNLTGATDTLSSVSAATFAFSDGQDNLTEDDSTTSPWTTMNRWDTTEFNYTASIGLQDGEYRLWFNVSDGQGNIRYKNRNVTIDRNGPDVFFNSDGNEVNATINDTVWDVRGSDVVFALENGTSTYWSGTGEKGVNSTLTRDGEYFYQDLDTVDFEDGSYTLHIWANDTNDNLGHGSKSTFYIDGTAPTVGPLNISNTSTLDSITNDTLLDVNASASDDQELDSCTLESYRDGTLIKTNDTTEDGSNYGIEGLDFSGMEGNLSFTMTCSDVAGNTDSNSTLTMTDGSQVSAFPIDDAAPTVDSSSLQPANDSYINDSQPDISFDITDFAGVENSSIHVWFNDTKQEYGNYTTTSSDGNSTITVSLDPGQLDEQQYNLTVNATDVRGKAMPNTSYSFTIDTTPPTIDEITTDDGTDVNDETWFGDDINYDITCTDENAGMESYELTRSDGDDIGEGEDTTGNATETLTFDVDDGIEGSVDLEFTCTDKAGNQQTDDRTDVNIDTSEPTVDRTPSSNGDVGRSSLPYSEDIEVTLSDDGAGFPTDWGEDELDISTVEFDDDSISDYDVNVEEDEITISWTQDEIGIGTHDIEVSGDFRDGLDNGVSVGLWSYEVTENSDIGTTQTSNTDLTLRDVPESITLVPGRDRTLDLEVENTGDTQTAGDTSIDISGDDGLDATISPSDLDLDSGDTRALDLEISSTDSFSGSTDVTIEISYDGNTESSTLTVDANPGSPDLSITDAPSEIDVWDNETATTASVTVENTGDNRATGLEATVTGFNTGDTEPSTLTVRAGQSSTIDIPISTEDKTVGTYTETLRLSNDDQTVSQEIDIKVQPAETETRQNITVTISSLGSQVSEIEDTDQREQLQQLVSDAQSAIADEDYAQAASLRDQIQDELQQVDTSQESSDSGLPILLILGVIGVAALAAGALAYIFLIRPEDTHQAQGETDDDTSTTTTSIEFSDTSSRVEHIGKQILAAADGFINAVESAIGSIIDSIGGSDDSDREEPKDEDNVEVDRKKIRFDEV